MYVMIYSLIQTKIILYVVLHIKYSLLCSRLSCKFSEIIV